MADDIGLRVVLLGVGEFRRGVGVIRSDLSGLQKELNGVSGPAASLSNKLSSMGDMMIQAGRSLTLGLTLPIVALGTSLVNAGIQFEDAFADVLKTTEGTVVGFNDLAKAMYGTTTGLSDAQKDAVFANEKFGQLTKTGEELRNQFRNLALEIPMSAVELAKLGGIAGQLGVPTDQILEFTKTVAMLGTATNMSASEAADAIARFANIMDVPSEKLAEFASRAGSAIVDLGNKSAATESQIVDLVYRISGAGNAIGLTAQEIIALSTSVAELGVRAEAGGSAVSRILLNIQSAAGEGGEQLKTYADMVGLTTQQFQELVKNSPLEAFYKVSSALASLQEQGKLSSDMLTELDLNTIRLRDVINRFGPDMGGLAQNVAWANTAWEEQIALEEEARKKYQTVKAQLTMLKSAFNELGITIFDLYKNEISNLISGIKGIFEALSKTDSKLIKTTVKFALLAAAIGPVLIALGTVVQLAGIAIGALGALAGPIGLIVLAAGALGIAFSTNFLGIRDIFNSIIGTAGKVVDAFKYISFWLEKAFSFGSNVQGGNLFSGLAASVKALTYVFEDAQTTFFSKMLEAFGLQEAAAQKLGMSLRNALAPALLIISAGLTDLSDIFNIITSHVQRLYNSFMFFTDGAHNLKTALDEFKAGNYSVAFVYLKMAIEEFGKWFKGPGITIIKDGITQLLAKFKTIGSEMAAVLKTAIPVVAKTLFHLAFEFVKWIGPAITKAAQEIQHYGSVIVQWLLNNLPEIIAATLELAATLVGWLGDAVKMLLPALGYFLGTLIGWIIGTLIPTIIREGPGIVEAFINFVRDLILKVPPALKNLTVAFIDYFINDLFPATIGFFGGLAAGIKDGLIAGLGEEGWQDLQDWFKTAWDNVKAEAEKIWDYGGDLLNKLWEGIKNGWEGFKTAFKALWALLKYEIAWLMDFGSDLIQKFKDKIDAAWEGFKTFFRSLWEILVFDIKAVMNIGQTIIDQIQSKINEAWTNFKNFVSGLFQGIVDEIKEKLDIGRDILNSFIEVGKNIVEGLKQGVEAAWQSFVDFLWDRYNELPEVLRKVLESFSPSHVMAREGENIVRGLQMGIEKSWPDLLDSFSKLSMRIPETISMTGFTNVPLSNTTNINRSSTRVFAPNITGVPITDQGQLTNDLSRMYRMATLANYA